MAFWIRRNPAIPARGGWFTCKEIIRSRGTSRRAPGGGGAATVTDRAGQYANADSKKRVQGEQKVFLHPVDAAARSIEAGEHVRVFNDRGEVQKVAAPAAAEMSAQA